MKKLASAVNVIAIVFDRRLARNKDFREITPTSNSSRQSAKFPDIKTSPGGAE
jgi:hypothetical protein